MTDYNNIFPDCALMIRDNGPGTFPNVEFWFYAGGQNANYGLVQFEKRVNQVTTVFSVDIRAHMGWVQISVDNAINSQYVRFQLDTNLGFGNHGSADPGFPYITNTYLSRPVVPDPPSRPYLTNVSVSSMTANWTPPGNNGGATILGYQLGYGTDPTGPTTIIDANSGVNVSNLATGTMYYFWTRCRNYQGWSVWSTATSQRTYLGLYVKTGGVWKIAVPYVNVSGVWKEAEPNALKT